MIHVSRKAILGLGAMVALALGLRLWLLGHMAPPPFTPDAANYSQMARQLLDRGVYGYLSETSNAYVTPGYPLFLAVIFGLGGSEATVRIIQAVLGACTLIPLALLAREVAGDWGAVASGLMLALYPAWLRAPAYLLTEVLFTFQFSLYLWVQWRAVKGRAWERPLWPLLSGLTLGLAVLTRPLLAPLLLLPWLWLMWRERSLQPWRALAWAVGGFVLVLAPWWLRNLLVLHKLILFATQTGNPILGGMDPYGMWNGKLWEGVGPDTGDQMRRSGEIFLWLLREHPALTLKWFTLGKFSRIFLSPWLAWEFPTLVQLHNPVVILGWVGAVAGLGRRQALQPLSLTLLFLTLIQLAFIPESRYAYPLIGLLAITGAFALVRIFGGGEPHGRGANPDPGV